MKKNHLFLTLAITGAALGGIAAGYGIGSSIKTSNEVNQITAKLNEGEEEQSKIKELEAKIVELMNNQLIKSIVSYSTSVAGIAGFIITLAKYRKYKAVSSQEIAELTAKTSCEALQVKYDELENKLFIKLNNKIDQFKADTSSAIAVLQKIIILSQDKTPKGVAALYEYLDTKLKEDPNTQEDVKEVLEEAKEANQEEIEHEEEIKEQVASDYEDVKIE